MTVKSCVYKACFLLLLHGRRSNKTTPFHCNLFKITQRMTSLCFYKGRCLLLLNGSTLQRLLHKVHRCMQMSVKLAPWALWLADVKTYRTCYLKRVIIRLGLLTSVSRQFAFPDIAALVRCWVRSASYPRENTRLWFLFRAGSPTSALRRCAA